MNKKIKSLLSCLKTYKPDKVILFGSGAHGEFKKGSDLDVLIIKKTTDPYWTRQKKIASIIEGDIDVDAFVLTPKEVQKALDEYQPFIYDIITYGKVIYG